ncbi:Hsp20 family protein [Rhodanobacter ginsengisoli]|uniref:Hsp20 family protein n=1 Tax=Rhodanobacter ginsengisoli TaxID=418646 RepID=A0ABW0QPR2_9GAMM
MTSMTRWNPIKAVSRFDPVATFDDLFRGLTTRPMWRDLEASPDLPIDVTEDAKAFHIKAEMPGITKDDIEVSVEGSQVAISAEVRRETKKKDDERELYTERYYGKVYRAFSLPSDIDSSKADARYDNGVLHLTLPKKSNGSMRKIAVN